jgi:hypothetical protein
LVTGQIVEPVHQPAANALPGQHPEKVALVDAESVGSGL